MNRLFLLIASIAFISSVSYCEPLETPTVIIGLIQHGTVQFEKYRPDELKGSLSQEVRNQHRICTLDLSNSEYCINTISCDQSTNKLIKLSEQEIINDHSFVINWGALFGINMADYQIDCISFIPWQHHHITSNHLRQEVETQETSMKVIYLLHGNLHEELVHFDCLIDSICGIISSDDITIDVNKTPHLINFKEAIDQGILVPEKNVATKDKRFTMERDAEFDRIIDAMSKEGIIKFQKVTPFVALLRRVGGILLVKYLSVKKYISSFFPQPPDYHKPIVKQVNDNITQ